MLVLEECQMHGWMEDGKSEGAEGCRDDNGWKDRWRKPELDRWMTGWKEGERMDEGFRDGRMIDGYRWMGGWKEGKKMNRWMSEYGWTEG